jgi:hypothetical protein
MAKTIVIGAVSNYEYDKIEPWLVSLRRTGYTGDVALVAYNMDAKTAETLTEKNVIIFAFNKDEKGNLSYSNQNFSIMIERFAHIWAFLKDTDYDNVIATDVRDVIFQTNPDHYMRDDIAHILVGTENLNYEDEPWGKNNLTQSFGPLIYKTLEKSPIVCAGVIAGTKKVVMDLMLQTFLLCRGAPSQVPGGGGPDQAALNILLSSYILRGAAKFYNTEEDFVVHLGTSLPAIEAGSGEIGQRAVYDPTLISKFEKKMHYKGPKFEDNLVKNDMGVPYCIVHQYNRVPQWNEILDKLYRE